MKATGIKMMCNRDQSNNLLEIDEIYLFGNGYNGFYKKGFIYDYLMVYPGTIQVNIFLFPECIPAKSPYGEKYVKSAPDSYSIDNLLNLPRF